MLPFITLEIHQGVNNKNFVAALNQLPDLGRRKSQALLEDGAHNKGRMKLNQWSNQWLMAHIK